jgi:hypothetical protein
MVGKQRFFLVNFLSFFRLKPIRFAENLIGFKKLLANFFMHIIHTAIALIGNFKGLQK